MHSRIDVQEQGYIGKPIEDGRPACQELDGGTGVLEASRPRLQL